MLGQGCSHFLFSSAQQGLLVKHLKSAGNRVSLRITEWSGWSLMPAGRASGDSELLDVARLVASSCAVLAGE